MQRIVRSLALMAFMTLIAVGSLAGLWRWRNRRRLAIA
jgi:hypothetical protein